MGRNFKRTWENNFGPPSLSKNWAPWGWWAVKNVMWLGSRYPFACSLQANTSTYWRTELTSIRFYWRRCFWLTLSCSNWHNFITKSRFLQPEIDLFSQNFGPIVGELKSACYITRCNEYARREKSSSSVPYRGVPIINEHSRQNPRDHMTTFSHSAAVSAARVTWVHSGQGTRTADLRKKNKQKYWCCQQRRSNLIR